MKAVICDLDGTLCDVTHRRHFVSGGKRNYDAFNAACVNDPCVEPIRVLLDMIDNYYPGEGVAILLCSGRGNEYRHETEQWLEDFEIAYTGLYMRPNGDYRSDVIVKREMLRHIEQEGYEVLFVIDDRQSVVDMWREEGLTCLQCAPGDFDTKKPHYSGATLHLLVGPSGAGKSTYSENNIDDFPFKNVFISSDEIRLEICGDFRDQSKNQQVFNALHAIVKARIDNGLDTVVDATNIKNADRRALRDLCHEDTKIVYHVIDRPLSEKIRDGGWRLSVDVKGMNLVERHHEIMQANLKDILKGDGDSRVEVRDMRHG